MSQPCSSGKVAYSSRSDALEAALSWALKDVARRGAAAVNRAYRCPECAMWHRTSQGRGKN